jgi:hypothetical protein
MSNAAPDLKTLLDFETNIESAAATFIATETGLATSSVFSRLDQDTFVLPRAEVMFDLGEALDPPDIILSGSADLEYRKYTGQFRVAVVSDGSQPNSQALHREHRAKVRAAMLRNASNWNATNLPYYDVKYIRPLSTDYETDGDLLMSTLVYDIHFAIRNDSWPTPPPPPAPGNGDD